MRTHAFSVPALNLDTPYAQLPVIHLCFILCELFVAHIEEPIVPGGPTSAGAGTMLSLLLPATRISLYTPAPRSGP